ncbi:MAG: biotin--[acetyl-CoA-carboxylase] ligase, partial [Lachnospiraceae bacterium]|nr:biotin--[acetyl-CoA-carboxylase] ligase [Lachnospiraceae bacterium]
MHNNNLSKEEIKSLLPFDLDVIDYEELDSTNTEAKRLIADSNLKKACLIANRQTNGRGRVGHAFFSPKETGIYMSFVFTPNSLEKAYKSTAKACVCVKRAIDELYGLSIGIKWVNDLYLDNKKICGILTEAVTTGVNKGSVVVGIGINFLEHELSDELKPIVGFLPKKETVTRNILIAKIISNLETELSDLDDDSYIEEYKGASILIGEDISYVEGD